MMAGLNETPQGFSSRPGTKALVLAAEGKAVSAGIAVADHRATGTEVEARRFGDLFYRLNVVSIPSARCGRGTSGRWRTCSGISLASLYRKLDSISS